jgi:hypothetical protein
MFRKYHFIITLILGILSLLAVSVFWKNNLIVFFILTAFSIILLISRSKTELILFLFCGISGMIAEVVAIFFGTWNYSNPSFFGVPIWLPILWAIASIYMIRIAKFLEKHERRRRLLNFFKININL